ncbi:MAG TPA: ABC transporter permease [Vicinamibacterales bacterium]|nr:ABC transporter permease [Vicinamibacterales bacterium]
MEPPDPRDIDAELDFHLEMQTRRYVDAGLDPAAARARALQRLGDLDAMRQSCRDLSLHTERSMMRSASVHAFVADMKLGFRSLRRTPGFTVLAALTLALGIGGTITVFAAVDAAFFKPLPYPEEQAMVRIFQRNQRALRVAVPWLVANDYRDLSSSFASMGLWMGPGQANVTTGTEPRRAGVAVVTSGFFTAMGATPLVGRTFAPEEITTGASPVAVISERFWRDAMGRQADVLGSRLLLDGSPTPIVGVLPASFAFPVGTDVWINLERRDPDTYGTRTAHNFSVVARLKPGVSVARAQADLDAVTERLKAEYPDVKTENNFARVVAFREDLLGPQASMLVLGLGSVLLVLAISCVNVINLLLARGVSRETEASVRMALGADGWSLVRPFLAESVSLALIGGVGGVLLASWGVYAVASLAPAGVLPEGGLVIDAPVAAGALLLTIVIGVVCGILPALRTSRGNVRAALGAGARSVTAAPRRTMLMLVGAEVALTFMLLVGAGLFGRTLKNLADVDLGFRLDGVNLMVVGLNTTAPSPHEDADARARLFGDLEDRVRRLGPIQQVGLAAFPPLSPFSPNTLPIIEGRTPDRAAGWADYRLVGGDFFDILGLKPIAGRVLTSADDASHPLVAVINASARAAFFPDGSPLGQRVHLGSIDGDKRFATIVGVVPDIQHFGPSSAPLSEIYFSYRQKTSRTHTMTLLTRSSAPPDVVNGLLRKTMADLEPTVAPRFDSFEAQLAGALAPARFRAVLLGLFAVVALALAMVGLAGVVSYATANRTQEMAIRMALGADRRRVTTLVVREGMTPALIGLAIGATATLLAARYYGNQIQAFLFNTEPRDAGTFVVVAVVLVVVTLLANFIPARRAAKISPMQALRR